MFCPVNSGFTRAIWFFRHGGQEVLRLSGVSRPEIVRRTCQTAHDALVSVRDVVRQQTAEA